MGGQGCSELASYFERPKPMLRCSHTRRGRDERSNHSRCYVSKSNMSNMSFFAGYGDRKNHKYLCGWPIEMSEAVTWAINFWRAEKLREKNVRPLRRISMHCERSVQ